MSQVYVANGTLQHRDFQYRFPGYSLRMVRINAGTQELLPEDFDELKLPEIIQQLENAGAIPATAVNYIAHPKSLLYRVAKTPIKSETIEEAMAKDEEARGELAAEKMEQAGFAAFAA